MLASTATPNDAPTCRCVVNSDEARPFCDGGMVA
jgi:CDGSH-type Zn-finger protein